MSGAFKGTCRVCGRDTDVVRNIYLYVIGSEGLDICHECEMQLVAHVRAMIDLGTRARKDGWIAARRIAGKSILSEAP